MDKLDGIKCLLPISLSQSNDYLDTALSPKSVESQTSCRSHDGVFLRPDAISTQSSPSSASTTPTMTALLSNRLTKRTSVDSGINVDLSIPSFRSSIWSRNKNQTREFQLMNSSNSITTAASLVTAATAAGIDTSNDTFSLCEYKNSQFNFQSILIYFILILIYFFRKFHWHFEPSHRFMFHIFKLNYLERLIFFSIDNKI